MNACIVSIRCSIWWHFNWIHTICTIFEIVISFVISEHIYLFSERHTKIYDYYRYTLLTVWNGNNHLSTFKTMRLLKISCRYCKQQKTLMWNTHNNTQTAQPTKRATNTSRFASPFLVQQLIITITKTHS